MSSRFLRRSPDLRLIATSPLLTGNLPEWGAVDLVFKLLALLSHKNMLMYNTHKRFIMKQATEAVFRAISDPTRRKIIDLLAKSQQSVKQLTANFDISQPAVSQHLRELRASKLVQSQRVGVERIYSLTADPLADVYHWVSRYRRLFDPSGQVWAFTPATKKISGQESRKGSRSNGD